TGPSQVNGHIEPGGQYGRLQVALVETRVVVLFRSATPSQLKSYPPPARALVNQRVWPGKASGSPSSQSRLAALVGARVVHPQPPEGAGGAPVPVGSQYCMKGAFSRAKPSPSQSW